MKLHRIARHKFLGLTVFACAPIVGCSNGDTWSPSVPGDETQVTETGSPGSDSTTPSQDSSSNTDSGSGADSTVLDDSSSNDAGSTQDDATAVDGATPDDTGATPDAGIADDTGVGTDTGAASDSADAGVADSSPGPDVASSDASDAGPDARDASLDGSDAAADASEAGADAADAAPVDAGVDAAKCAANVLAPTTAVASPLAIQPAANAFDTMFGTRWESVHGVDPQWIYLDFGAPVYISRVQIAWETACAKNYDLQVSNNLTTWTTMTSVAGNTNGGPAPANWTTAANHPALSAFGRYFRINGTARCSMYGYSIWEVRVFGDTNGTCTP